MRHRFVRDLCDSGCEKFKKILARRGGASRPARPARRAKFFIFRVKVYHSGITFWEHHSSVGSIPAYMMKNPFPINLYALSHSHSLGGLMYF